MSLPTRSTTSGSCRLPIRTHGREQWQERRSTKRHSSCTGRSTTRAGRLPRCGVWRSGGSRPAILSRAVPTSSRALPPTGRSVTRSASAGRCTCSGSWQRPQVGTETRAGSSPRQCESLSRVATGPARWFSWPISRPSPAGSAILTGRCDWPAPATACESKQVPTWCSARSTRSIGTCPRSPRGGRLPQSNGSAAGECPRRRRSRTRSRPGRTTARWAELERHPALEVVTSGTRAEQPGAWVYSGGVYDRASPNSVATVPPARSPCPSRE